MPLLLSTKTMAFPAAHQADENGIVAIGGDFLPQRLLLAYQAGIFPWPHQGLPILWFCPNPRFVLDLKQIKVSRSLAKAIRQSTLTIKADHNFLAVMKRCQQANRQHQEGTWITDEMINGYYKLFQQGFAHSIEAYENDALVGGLYGVSLGSIFFGESMFFLQSNASKICLVSLVAHLLDWRFSLIDCQAHTHNLENFGAKAIDRDYFLSLIKSNQTQPTKRGPWQLSMSPQQALVRINQPG